MILETLQNHVQSRVLALPARAKDLTRELRNVLIEASNARKLLTSPGDIHKQVLLLDEPPPSLAGGLRARGYTNAYCIVGGQKNLKRDRSLGHFARDDHAWFDFTITVRQAKTHLELLAYDFEIRFPPGTGAPFLRFDLNLPAHRNDDRELRSHLHPGSNDILVPAPLMSPLEVLKLFIDGLRVEAHRDAARDPTAFEIDWFRDTHVALAARDARQRSTRSDRESQT